MPTLLEAITAEPEARAFRRGDRIGSEPTQWQFEPLRLDVLPESEDFYVIGALNVLSDGRVNKCYMDISLPERINDYAYFVDGSKIRRGYPHQFEGEFIPAIAIDCFGIYELFYSKIAPDIGIDVLRRGLAVSKRKHIIAEDLGYIYRDERRHKEAAEMFQLAVDEGPSSYFMYGELARAYSKLRDVEKAKKYSDVFEQGGLPEV